MADPLLFLALLLVEAAGRAILPETVGLVLAEFPALALEMGMALRR